MELAFFGRFQAHETKFFVKMFDWQDIDCTYFAYVAKQRVTMVACIEHVFSDMETFHTVWQ